MISKFSLQPAVVLHKRPYKETSYIIDFFTREFGRVSAVANGIRRPKSPLRETFSPFSVLLITCGGKNNLKKLFDSEVRYRPDYISNKTYSCLIYLNELIMAFLHKEDPHLNLFDNYVHICKYMPQIEVQAEIEKYLRRFELTLLQEIGYGIDLEKDADSGEELNSNLFYEFNPMAGFINRDHLKSINDQNFKGEDIINFSKGIFDSNRTRKTAKQITRKAIDFHLDGKEIKSRDFFLAGAK